MAKKALVTDNKLYDALKFIAQVVLPALGTLYFALAQIWGLPGGAETVGTITVVDTFLGVLLHLNSQVYNNSDDKYDGSMDVEENDTAKSYSLNLHGDPADLDKKKQVVFKVNPKKKTPMAKKVAAARKKA